MAFVSTKSIEDIKNRVDITDIVSPYVTLKRSGAHWKGLSPFTQEKTPSFYVMPEKGIFKCFSSGYAGDIFRFLQLKENLSFQEAIDSIAHKYNIPLEYDDKFGLVKEEISLKKQILEIHELALYFFCEQLHSPSAKNIQEYWQNSRHFTLDDAKQYSIGFAPVERTALIEYISRQKKKFSNPALKECGLFYFKGNGNSLTDFSSRFRGRLMIPIKDVQGRVIAFAGRKLDCTPQDDPAHEAKYINSPETPIFNKSKTVFGLDHARQHIKDTDYFILVEGQLDTIRCWSKGFHTTVAPQGTGITDLQLNTIRRYTNKIFCILDGDTAGQNAALRAIPIAMKADLEIKFVQLSQKEDPDDFLQKNNPELLLKKINTAQSWIHYACQHHWNDNLTPQEKNNGLKEIYDLLLNCKSSVAIEEYLLELSKITHINRQNIEEDFARYRKQKTSKTPQASTSSTETYKEKLTSAEDQLLLLILHHDHIAQPISNIVNTEWLDPSTLSANLLTKIFAEIQEDLWDGPKSIDQIIQNDDEKNFIYSMLIEPFLPEDPYSTANLIIKAIYQKYLTNKKNLIDSAIAQLSPSSFDKLRALQNERVRLRNLISTPPKIIQEELEVD